MSPGDRRDTLRLGLDPGKAVARLGEGSRAQVRDLSAGGGSLVVSGDPPAAAGSLRAWFELGDDEMFLADLEIVRVRPVGSGAVELGARFGHLERSAVSALARFMSREGRLRGSDPARLVTSDATLRITSPVLIAGLLGGRLPRSVQVVEGDRSPASTLKLVGVTFEGGRQALRIMAPGAAAALDPGRSYTFLLVGPGAVTVFEARCVARLGDTTLVTFPGEVRQTGFRASPRVPLLHDKTGVVTYLHPRLGVHMRAPLHEVSWHGLSFAVDPREHALFAGDQLPAIRIGPAGRELEARGVVRSISPRSTILSCGIELIEFADRQQAEAWRRFVFKQMHPALDSGSAGGADAAWRALEASRYVSLWTTPEAGARLRRLFFQAWEGATPEVGHALVRRPTDRSQGIAAGSLLYPGTWMIHHLGLAAAPEETGARRVMALDLIAGIIHRLQQATDLEHFVVYFEDGHRWSDEAATIFARGYFDPAASHLRRVDVVVVRTDGPADDAAVADGPEIVPADAVLWGTLAEGLKGRLPPIEIAAFSLDRARIDLEEFSHWSAARGYERRRGAFFALRDGQAVAALVVETGNEGANVFGLLNTCRVFGLAPGELAPAIRAALLRRAVEYYREAGKATFLFLDDETQEVAAGKAPVGERVLRGQRWIARADVIAPWVAYLEGLTSLARQTNEAARPSGSRAPATGDRDWGRTG